MITLKIDFSVKFSYIHLSSNLNMIIKAKASNDIVFYIAHLRNGYRNMADRFCILLYIAT